MALTEPITKTNTFLKKLISIKTGAGTYYCAEVFMEVIFEKQGNKTLLNITSTFESVDQMEQVIKVFKADIGLKQNMERLERYILSEDEPFIIERTYNAPVAKVWLAITDKDQMKQWYFDIPSFKPEVGLEFQFTGGPDEGPHYVHLCRITEVIPYKKLTHSWRYEGYRRFFCNIGTF